MKRWGIIEPIIVNKDHTIIGGHQRYKALKEAGEKMAPCVVVDLKTTEARALNLALNRISGDWDEPGLKTLMKELEAAGMDLSLTGFEEKELLSMLTPDPILGLTDPDSLPENVETVTNPGDIWALGEHRVVCGDVLQQRDLPRVQAIITDPPFGVRQEAWDSFKSDTEFRSFTERWMSKVQQSAPLIVTFFTDKFIPLLRGAAESIDLGYRRGLVWRKPPGSQFAGATYDGFWYDFELIQVFGEPSFKIARDPRMAVLEHRTVTNQMHGCEKPVALLAELIDAYSESGHRIMDPFLGSGTTLIAAEQLGRICHGIEIEPKYVDVSVQRWEKFTGRKAVRL